MGEYLYEEITRKIIGAAFDVHNALGKGLTEKAYENALVLRLRDLGLSVEQQKPIALYFQNQRIGYQEVDILVEEKVIVELKARDRLTQSNISQLLGYLKNTKYQLGLLVNFGRKVEIKRFILSIHNH
jgi:GxxExxY protein